MQPGARSSAVNSSSGLQYGSSGMSGTDGKYDGSMDKASSLLDEADGKLKAMGKNARLHSVHSGNIGTRGGANARQQAAAINSMLRSAEDASGSVLARSRMDAAWEGKIADESQTVQGTGIDSGENMVFDPAGQAEKQGSQGFAGVGASGGGNHKEADVPEVSESENVTPWAKELKALKYIFK